jgi:hypothetical protein
VADEPEPDDPPFPFWWPERTWDAEWESEVWYSHTWPQTEFLTAEQRKKLDKEPCHHAGFAPPGCPRCQVAT